MQRRCDELWASARTDARSETRQGIGLARVADHSRPSHRCRSCAPNTLWMLREARSTQLRLAELCIVKLHPAAALLLFLPSTPAHATPSVEHPGQNVTCGQSQTGRTNVDLGEKQR